MMAGGGEDVYCTLLMSDSYLPGVAVLAHSLRDSGTKKKLAVLVTLDSLLYTTITELKSLFDYVIPVDKISNPNLDNLVRLDRLDLRFAFTKINLWRQVQFRRIVYIDADVVALRSVDELFDLDVLFAAAPDIGWPDCFNSGVMVLTPNAGDYWSLYTLASSSSSFDGADQGLLNEYFGSRPWHRLSFTYNCTPSSGYQYEPAYRHFRSSIKMAHFIGKEKPWQAGRTALRRSESGVYKELLGQWWSVYDRHYKISYSSALGQVQTTESGIRQFVQDEDEASNNTIAWATTNSIAERSASQQSHFAPVSSEQPSSMLLGTESEESAQSSFSEHTSQMFQAPQMEWDATRSEPPAHSKPEAHHFQTSRYEMSQDTGLFHAPAAYPAPPKDMYYTLPDNNPQPQERPKPIFPWESENAQRPKPSRVFADEPQITQPPHFHTQAKQAASDQQPPPTLLPSAPIKDPWSAFTLTNAWDNNSSIQDYVRAVKHAQATRGQIQVLKNDSGPVGTAPSDSAAATHNTTTEVVTPPAVAGSLPQANNPTRFSPKRRESLILTDFPTEFERPSLPVTPAPIRRPMFWAVERDSSGELPPAEGVPDQNDWDPHAQLEMLRKSSLVRADEMPDPAAIEELLNKKTAPQRDLPESSQGFLSSLVPGGESEASTSGMGPSTANVEAETSASGNLITSSTTTDTHAS